MIKEKNQGIKWKIIVANICLIPQPPLLFLILKNIYSELSLDTKSIAFPQPMTIGHLLNSGLIHMPIHYQGTSAFPASYAFPMLLGKP